MKALFTKTERFLMRQNRAFVITSDASEMFKSPDQILNPRILQEQKLGKKFKYLLAETGIHKFENQNLLLERNDKELDKKTVP